MYYKRKQFYPDIPVEHTIVPSQPGGTFTEHQLRLPQPAEGGCRVHQSDELSPRLGYADFTLSRYYHPQN